MPTYEYLCEKCGHEFELFQSMKDDALTQCPKDKCAKNRWSKGQVKRAIGSGAGLIFKGDGFYITDYRSEGYKADAKKDKPSSDSSSKKSDGKKKSDGGSKSKSTAKAKKKS